jgi:enoyl-CoA hydratase/carnithine racemase
MTDAIQIERERGLLTLRLNRPEKKNALTRAMYSHLAEALKQADTDPEINAVLITGSSESSNHRATSTARCSSSCSTCSNAANR